MAEKERLDVLLVKNNPGMSRELAKSLIMAGKVYVSGMKEDKAGTKVDIYAPIEVRDPGMKYVSRGGYKLEKAMDEFGVRLEGKVCFDIGSSTGGFTDCMLQNGAVKVFAVDVGYGQLAWKLRNDERVICMEKTNVRYLTPEQTGERGSFASIDVSFISLTKVLPAVYELLDEKGELVCLIKPQFEAGREKVGKKGVVRDKNVHKEVIEKIVDYAGENKLGVLNIDYSPIKGPEGNIEYLIYLSKCEQGMDKESAYALADKTVERSHELL